MVSIQVNRNMLKLNRSNAKNVHFKVMIRYPSRRLFRSGNSHTLVHFVIDGPETFFTARPRAHAQGGALLRALTDRDLLGFRQRQR